jgi:hypothetical protein
MVFQHAHGTFLYLFSFTAFFMCSAERIMSLGKYHGPDLGDNIGRDRAIILFEIGNNIVLDRQ